MKTATIVIAIVGILLGTLLVGYFGFAEVGRALLAVGATGFLAIVAYHLAFIVLLGFCWYLVTPRPAPLPVFVWGRLIRDAGSEILPLSQLGGYIMGARAAMLLGLSGTAAVASTIVDVTVEVIGQLGFTALGLVILARLRPDEPLVGWIGFGLIAALLVVIGFVVVQRHGIGLIEHLVWRTATRRFGIAATQLHSIQHEIHEIYRHPGRLGLATLLHLAAWVASSVEAWIALALMGANPGLIAVIALESILAAVRSVAFAVPNAVGVQEAAYVMLGATFGLPPQVALAVSILKRARDLAIGVPALLVWQAIESRRLLARRSRGPDGMG
jgi:putative membrane protein